MWDKVGVFFLFAYVLLFLIYFNRVLAIQFINDVTLLQSKGDKLFRQQIKSTSPSQSINQSEIFSDL